MIKLEKVTPGMILMDVHREKMGNTTMSQWGLWYVRVLEVDLPGNRALVRWNNNAPKWWSRTNVEKLHTKEPKAYRDQQERRRANRGW